MKSEVKQMGGCQGAEDTGKETHTLELSPDEGSMRAKFEAAGQGHVFNAYEDLSESEKQELLTQCS